MLLQPPAVVSSPDQILGFAQHIVDDDVAAVEAALDVAISCAPGCSACCHQLVPVTAAEVRAVNDAIEAMTPDHRHAVRGRIEAAAGRLRAAGIGPGGGRGRPDTAAARADIARRYFEQQVMCPLLEDGVCGVRESRPLVCREYVVTSDPKHCAELSRQIVRIRPRRDVLAGFAAVSEAFGDGGHHILAMALADGVAPEPEEAPKSGVSVTRLLTRTYLADD